MVASHHLGAQFIDGLARSAQTMSPENRSFVEGVIRTAGTGHKGPVDAMDADTIDRTRSTIDRLNDFGMSASPLGGEQARGFVLDMGHPDHNVTVTPVKSGYAVDMHHAGRFDTDDAGNYVHPSSWGSHQAVLEVGEHELPGALMDHLARPEVRRRAGF